MLVSYIGVCLGAGVDGEGGTHKLILERQAWLREVRVTMKAEEKGEDFKLAGT